MGAGREPLDIHALVREAYWRFDCHPPRHVGVCSAPGCCLPHYIADAMLRTPPTEHDPEWIRGWFQAAIASGLEFERGHPVRWILPRVLDLLAAGEDVDWFDCALALDRLRYAGFPDDWEKVEVGLISVFCRARVDAADWTWGGPHLDDYLCMIARAPVDLDPVLAALNACATADLVLALHPDRHGPQILETTFWEDDAREALSLTVARDAVRAWYSDRNMTGRLLNYATGKGGDLERRRRSEVLAEDTLAR